MDGNDRRWLRRANRMIIALQRVGIAFGPMYLLTLPGHRTGQPRTAPVAVLELDGGRYVVQAYPGAQWVANARAAGSGVLTRGRVARSVTLTELPVTERAELLRRLPAVSGTGGRIFVRSGMSASAEPDDLAAAAPRCAVFRVDEPGHVRHGNPPSGPA